MSDVHRSISVFTEEKTDAHLLMILQILSFIINTSAVVSSQGVGMRQMFGSSLATRS